MASLEWKKVTDEQVVQFQRKQHAIKQWIEKVLDIELDSEDLYVPLKSGVILCYLMQKLDKRAIPRIQEDTKQVFKLKENVEFFVAACKDLGVPPHKLFKGPDLWDNQSIVNVIECLVALAAIVQQQYEGAPPLVMDNNWKHPTLNEKDKIAIKKQLIKVKDKPEGGARVKISSNIVLKKLALMAGNGVDINKYVPGFIRFQSLVRGYLQRQKYKSMVRNAAYRDHVAREILDTEKFYVKHLSLCVNVWLNPLNEALASGSPILAKEDIRAIFSDIPIIYNFNSQLLASIEQRVNNWTSSTCMGDIFLQIMDFLKVYTAYVQNFNTSMAVVERVQKKKEVAAYFQKCKENPEGRSLDLASFLIMPVQRIPRYNLLLTDILKHTWKDHPDYENLQKTTDKIQSIAAFINDKKREAENISKTLEISNRMIGKDMINLAEPHRRFVREGLFGEVGSKEEVVVCLFSDILVVAKPEKKLVPLGKSTLRFKQSHKLELIDTFQNTQDPNVFDLVQMGKTKALLKLIAKSQKERDDWVKDIKTCKSGLAQQKDNKEKILERERSSTKPKLSAEEKLLRRNKNDEDSEEKSQLQNLQAKREAIIKQLVAIKAEGEPDGDKKKKRKQTKQQKKDALRILDELEAELGEIEVQIAKLHAKEEESKKELKRKEPLPDNAFKSSSVRAPFIPKKPAAGENKPPSPPQSNIQAQVQVQTQSQLPPAAPALPLPNNATESFSAETDITSDLYGSSSPKLNGQGSGIKLKTQKKEQKEAKKKERQESKRKLKEEKKQEKEEKKAKKKESGDKKKLKTVLFGKDRRGTGSFVAQDEKKKEEPDSSSSSNGNQKDSSREIPSSPVSERRVEPMSPAASPAPPEPRQAASSSNNDTKGGEAAEAEDEKQHWTYEELKKHPWKLDRTKLESYLSPEDFETVFGMTKTAFYELPVWKQRKKKEEKNLL